MANRSTEVKKRLGRIDSLSSKTIGFLGSTNFFVFLVVIFILQASWVAISSKYSLPYDESYHVGIISAFEKTISPFAVHQDASQSSLGDITRYGSYLYHYAFSFIGRIVEIFSGDSNLKVEILRFVNISVFVGAIIYIRKLLTELKFSSPVANVAIGILVFIPTVPFLAATINYESLFILLAALHLIVFVRLSRSMFTDITLWTWLIASGVAGSLTKYAFLPIFASTALLSLAALLYQHKKSTIVKLRTSLARLKKGRILLLGVVVLGSIGLFSERYIYNLFAYGSPSPDCSKVLSVDSCSNWGPWERNHALDVANKDQQPGIASAAYYAFKEWEPDMISTATLVGGANSERKLTLGYASKLSLGILQVFAIIGSFLFMLSIFVQKRRSGVSLVIVPIAIYVTVLFAQNYSDYLKLGAPAGVQGRYLLWALPIIASMTMYGFGKMISGLYPRWKQSIKLALLGIVVVAFSQFGGLTTYFYRSEPTWFWQQDSTVARINDFAKKIATKVVIGK